MCFNKFSFHIILFQAALSGIYLGMNIRVANEIEFGLAVNKIYTIYYSMDYWSKRGRCSSDNKKGRINKRKKEN
jgi:hypothetical protein